ncbi:MAG: hypothetical protein WA810_02600 [Maribacter sp.]
MTAQQTQTGILREYTTAPLAEDQNMAIDGQLNHVEWNQVVWQGDVTVFDPNNGKEPSRAMELKIFTYPHPCTSS